MCKYCDEQTEKAGYSDIIEGKVDFGFFWRYACGADYNTRTSFSGAWT